MAGHRRPGRERKGRRMSPAADRENGRGAERRKVAEETYVFLRQKMTTAS